MRACLAWAILVIGFGAAGCTEENASKFCVYNSDCSRADRPFCVAGICRAAQCLTDADCRLDEQCVEERCALRSDAPARDALEQTEPLETEEN